MNEVCRHCGGAIRIRPVASSLFGTPRYEWFHVETEERLCAGVRVPVAEPREEDGDGRD